MNNEMIELLEENNIKYYFKDGVYKLGHNYTDSNFIKCRIVVETKNVTENTINKILKYKRYAK